mmetsp:Transcript_1384/g.4631  ORF Transcript_1384/g.4631 Transcript_1384/m.4631 type:complete len:276 (+) Transcript_1384:501-1328(+)
MKTLAQSFGADAFAKDTNTLHCLPIGPGVPGIPKLAGTKGTNDRVSQKETLNKTLMCFTRCADSAAPAARSVPASSSGESVVPMFSSKSNDSTPVVAWFGTGGYFEKTSLDPSLVRCVTTGYATPRRIALDATLVAHSVNKTASTALRKPHRRSTASHCFVRHDFAGNASGESRNAPANNSTSGSYSSSGERREEELLALDLEDPLIVLLSTSVSTNFVPFRTATSSSASLSRGQCRSMYASTAARPVSSKSGSFGTTCLDSNDTSSNNSTPRAW